MCLSSARMASLGLRPYFESKASSLVKGVSQLDLFYPAWRDVGLHRLTPGLECLHRGSSQQFVPILLPWRTLTKERVS